MPIPILMSEIRPALTDWVQSGAGIVEFIPKTAYYFLLTSKITSGNGQSYLSLLSALLTASTGGATTWTVTLTATFRVKLIHNSGSPIDLKMDAGLAYLLGLNGLYQPGVTATFPGVTSGAGVTLSFPPVWLWTPDQIISDVGPTQFDPQLSSGIRSAAGTASRAPDQTASYTTNGVQMQATYVFRAVSPYYKAHPNEETFDLVHQREDFTTFWLWGPRLGRRVLVWKDRTETVGVTQFIFGGGTPYPRYYEYNPSDGLRASPTIAPSAPPNQYYWDITVGLWQTENGETPYT